MKEKILFININQYGYDASYYYYVKYLKDKYHIDYICIDHGKPIIEYAGEKITYCNKIKRKLDYFNLIFTMSKLARNGNYNHIIYRNSKFAFLIKLLSRKKGIYDVRTVKIGGSYLSRLWGNYITKFNCLFFENCLVISQYIAEELKLDKKKTSIVPLGSGYSIKRNNNMILELRFLYVGTFHNRNIHETINGFSIFCNKYPKKKVVYTIIGSGSSDDLALIDNEIKNKPKNLIIQMEGFVPNHLIKTYLKNNYIGVAYTPLKKWFYPQPVTKTYEYLAAGMVVIATALPSNKDVICATNGVLIDDNPESFSEGVEEIYLNLKSYNLNDISISAKKFILENIVENNLIKALAKNSLL